MRSLAILLLLITIPDLALSSPVKTILPKAEQRGQATFQWLAWPLYEARLFTKGGAPLDWNSDFAIELKYLRKLSEADLVESTLRELKRTGNALPVRAQLENCYANVIKGDRFLAVSDGQNKVGFWLNGKRMCTLAHPQIKNRFMAIFLGDDARSPSFARQLRGE